jgi:rare lipoprotein A
MRPIVLALAISTATAGLAQAKTCQASFYGAGERLNRHTANGEVYRPHGITAAHRTLPFGSRVKVVHGGRSVVVRINDRGPAKWTGRCIDLSLGAARKLGMVKRGVAPVRLHVIR